MAHKFGTVDMLTCSTKPWKAVGSRNAVELYHTRKVMGRGSRGQASHRKKGCAKISPSPKGWSSATRVTPKVLAPTLNNVSKMKRCCEAWFQKARERSRTKRCTWEYLQIPIAVASFTQRHRLQGCKKKSHTHTHTHTPRSLSKAMLSVMLPILAALSALNSRDAQTGKELNNEPVYASLPVLFEPLPPLCPYSPRTPACVFAQPRGPRPCRPQLRVCATRTAHRTNTLLTTKDGPAVKQRQVIQQHIRQIVVRQENVV